MRRLDEIVAEMLAGARERVVTEQEGVASNDDERPVDLAKSERFVRIAAEMNEAARKRKNRRRRRAKVG